MLSCKDSTQPFLAIPTLEKEITVDGVIGEEEWRQAVTIEGLLSPWGTDNLDNTNFKVFISDNYFNFCFYVEDTTLVTIPFKQELSVAAEDRVELFFSKDPNLSKYYCIEIDPKGNILDYSAEYYRHFKEDWGFKSKKVVANTTDVGYIIEGKISLKELHELGIVNPFYLGIFRADFKSSKSDDVTWFSWKKPNSSHPDFHIPSAFEKVLVK